MNTEIYAKSYANFYEKLSSKSPVGTYKDFFDENSEFEDPFQKLKGLEKIFAVFEDMYKKLYNPRFIVDEVVCSNEVAYLRWIFEYSLDENKEKQSFVGISRVTFNEEGKVKSHIDYWDASQHVYEKIPLLGSILRFIKSKLHA